MISLHIITAFGVYGVDPSPGSKLGLESGLRQVTVRDHESGKSTSISFLF